MIDTTPLGEQIEQALKQEILTGALVPGQRIAIEEFAEKWGTSSTPVRDAVKRLESKGFLKVAPRRGIYVTQLDWQTFKEIFEVRIGLECTAAELATPCIPDAKLREISKIFQEADQRLREDGDLSLLIEHDHVIHDVIVQYCGNSHLIEIMADLSDLIIWARAAIISHEPKAFEITLPEHLEIIDALVARDAEAAFTAVRRHLKNAYQRAFEVWQQHNGDGD